MLSKPRVEPSDVAIIVPVGGGAPFWDRCAASLALCDPAPGEIVAVIDGPKEELKATATDIGAAVLMLEEAGGPAKARNHGAQAATRDVLFFVDADVEVAPKIAAQVADLFDADRGISAMIGSYDDAPGDPRFLSQYRNLLHHFVHQRSSEEASTFWAGCGAIDREAFLEIGGFDARYAEPSIEDIELGARLRRAGHRIRLVKDLQVKHLKRWRLGDMLVTDLYHRAVPWTELMLRDRHLANDLNTRTVDRFSVVLAFLPLITLPSAWLWPPALGVSALALLLLGALNAPLFWFFRRKKGLLFALGTIPLYWVYLLVCGIGFSIGLFRHATRIASAP